MASPVVNSHNSWDPLEEVWLGDVYPASWYDHLAPEVRDVFVTITEKTQADLNVIQKKLESFGITVRRPVYDSIDDRLWQRADGEYCLSKPEITPRDRFAVIGQYLYTPPLDAVDMRPWSCHLQSYGRDSLRETPTMHVSGANIARVGKDLYFDVVYANKIPDSPQEQKKFTEPYVNEFPRHRLHFLDNGGHVDACFSLLCPGVILCNTYFEDYARTFPRWNLIKRSAPEFHSNRIAYRPSQSPHGNQKWWLEGTQFPKAFNEHVIRHALDWVGDFTETYFEVNCLSVDTKNVLVLGEHELLFRELENFGITAHPLPFRCRTFWDGGLHCLTLDIRRKGDQQDYFPERSPQTPVFYM